MSEHDGTVEGDYAAVMSVVQAARRESTDDAAREIAAYREECCKGERRSVIRAFLELQRKMELHAANGGDCPYEAKAVGAFAKEMRALAISLSADGWL